MGQNIASWTRQFGTKPEKRASWQNYSTYKWDSNEVNRTLKISLDILHDCIESSA